MKTQIRTLVTCLVLMQVTMAWAQFSQAETNTSSSTKGKLTLFIGPSIMYLQGIPSNNFDSYNHDWINFQANCFVGLMSAQSNAFGVFVTGGYMNNASFNKVLEIEDLKIENAAIEQYNGFYQVEGGILAADVVKFSTGWGRQYYPTLWGNSSFGYLSSSVGLYINLGALYWNIDANFNYGGDFKKTILKLSTGIQLRF